MELIFLIVAIILLVASVALSIANLFVSKKKHVGTEKDGGVIGEIETLNDNLNEVKNLINEHTSKEREILSGDRKSVV